MTPTKPTLVSLLVVAALAILEVSFRQTASVGHPTLTTNLPAGTVVWPGEVLEFTVQATSPQRDRVTLNLLNPPPGCVFSQDVPKSPTTWNPSAGNVVTATGHVRWLVPTNFGGLRRLTFRATDHTNAGLSLSMSIDVRVEGESYATTMVIGDVTGDGVLDTIAGARLADVNGKTDVGAVYVWKGTTAPTGAPDATLVVPGAVNYDELGSAWKGQGIQLADVTGDGVLDVVVGSYNATIGGASGAGAIYVWEGGSQLTGTPAPLATLTVPGAAAHDALGACAGQGIQLADVTGDGVLDVVAGAAWADTGGVINTGAIYVWNGGSTLVGSPAPLATLTQVGATTNDYFGMSVTQLVDVTGDGILDVVAGSNYVDVAGVVDAGAVYVWQGGATLVGTPAPLATLTDPSPTQSEMFGYVGDPQDWSTQLLPAQTGRIADVTGDGVRDLVVGAIYANAGSTQYAGAVQVWKGGVSLNGSPAPLATLTIPNARFADQLGRLGDGDSGSGIELVDLNGDGVLDVVVGASFADVGSVIDAGAVYVWNGGSTLAGAPTPLASLSVPGAAAGDELGSALGRGMVFGDMDGDGVRDLVLGTFVADVAGIVDTGAIYAWRGGATLTGTPTPLATLTVPGAHTYDALGSTGGFVNSGVAIQLVDVTGDGRPDVVASAPAADVVAGKKDGGAVYVWAGGPSFVGSLAPHATLYEPNGNTSDLLGQGVTGEQGVQVADVTGDRVLDVVVGSKYFDVGGVADTGMVFVWEGGPALLGSPAARANLQASNRVKSDMLGYAVGQSVQVADVTGDSVSDVVASAKYKDVNGKQDAGGMYVWSGGSLLVGTLDPHASLTDAKPVKLDYLGSAMNQCFLLADVDGDFVLDVATGSPSADAGATDTGALYLWRGGNVLTGSPALLAKLKVSGAKRYDQLSFWY